VSPVPYADVGGKELWYEEAGSGPAVVLTHAGVADSTMWDGIAEPLAERHRVVRYDLPGYGRSELPPGPWSHVDDLRGLLDHLGVERAAVVGLSHGGRVDLEFALEHPERVTALVLVAPGLPDHDWSEEAEQASDEEDRLFEAGDLEGAAEVNLRMWVDGPRRGPDAVPEVRERVRAMVLRSFELYRKALEQGEPGPVAKLDPPATARLDEIRVPTLVVYGDADTPDIVAISERLAAGIPGARKVVYADVAHMLPMERPAEFTRLVLDFLAETT
jgi:pimeloyl-ACP methyl ester carboxylesterase